MSTNSAGIYFDAGIGMQQWRNNISEIRRDLSGISNEAKTQTSKMDSGFKTLGLGLSTYFSGAALAGFVTQLISVRGEFQKTEIAFATMLGDGGKAKALMGQMIDLAAKTPFSLQDVSSGAKQLLAFQIPANQVVETLTRLGNVAAGLSVPLGRINLVYGQVKAKGKLMGDDLRQFTEAGIPMVAELAKKFNKTTAEISEMVTAGKIGFKDVQDVLWGMTNEGGMFFNLMEKQSKSLSGQISNLGDAFDQMLNEIGEGSEGFLSSSIQGVTYLVDNYKEVAKILTVLVSTYGAYRAAIIMTAVAQRAMAVGSAISTWVSLARGIKTAADAQALLNLTMAANPFGAVLAVIGLLVASYAMYGDELKKILGITDELTRKQEVQNAMNEVFVSNFSQGVAEQKAGIQNLIGIIKNEAATLAQREDAYKRLIAISPRFEGTLDKQFRATQKLGQAFSDVAKGMERFAVAQAQMSVKNDKLKEYTAKSFEAGALKNNVEALTKERNELIKLRNAKDEQGKGTAELTKKIISLYRTIEDEAEKWQETNEAAKQAAKIYRGTAEQIKEITNNLARGKSVIEAQLRGGKINGKEFGEEKRKELQAQLDSTNKDLEVYVGVTPDLKTDDKAVKNWVTTLKGQIEEASAKMDAAQSSAERQKWKKEKERLENILDPKGEKKEKKETTKKDLAEVYSKDSIADLEQRISLWNNALKRVGNDGKVSVRKIDKFGDEKLTGQVVDKDFALSELEKIDTVLKARQKELSNQSFSEEIQEIERKWSIRYSLAEKYGEEVAKAQFPDLKGDSYYSEIENQFKPLEVKVKLGEVLNPEEVDRFKALGDILNNLDGIKDPFSNFRDGLDSAMKEISSSAGKLEYLKDRLLNLTDSELSIGAKAELLNQIKQTEDTIKDSYQKFIEEHRSFEERKNQITQEYKTIRDQIEADPTKTPEQKAILTKKTDNAEKNAISQISLDLFKQSKDWEMAFGDMEYLSNSALDRILIGLQKFQTDSAGTLAPTEMRELEEAIKRVKSAMNTNPFSDIVNGLKDLKTSTEATKEAQEEYNAVMNNSGSTEEQKAAAVEKLSKAQLDSAEAKKKIVKGLGDGQAIFNAVGNGVKDLGDAFGGFDDATNDAIDSIMEIGNAALDLGKSIASGDVAGMIKAGVALIGSVFKALSGDKKKERNIKDWAKAVKGLQVQYQLLQETVKKALGEDIYSDQQKIISNLKAQQQLLIKMRNEEGRKKKKDNGKIDDYTGQINGINQQVSEIYDNIAKSIAQTDAKSLSDQLADALIEAYGKGEDAAEAYGKVADDVMRNAVKNALKMQLLEKPMQDMVKQLIKNMGFDENGGGSFDGLSEDERAQLKAMMAAASQNYMSALEAYGDLFGQSAAEAQSMKGDIKGVTEKTAGILEAQINAMRINQAEILRLIQLSYIIDEKALILLNQIEINTRHLVQMAKDISEINSKTNKSLAGVP